MTRTRAAYIAGGLLAVTAMMAGPAIAEEKTQHPAAPSGITAKLLSEINLADEFETTDGRILRMRVLTVPKGGLVGEHSHAERPSLEYVLQGSATEFRDGEEHSVTTSDAITADHTVTHSWRNDTDGDLVILAVDIYQPTE